MLKKAISGTIFTLFMVAAYSIPSILYAESDRNTPLIKNEIDWGSYLKTKNMVWKKAPTTWTDAPFLGNGTIGMQFMADRKNKNTLRLEVGHMGAQEHLSYESLPDISWAYARYRLPIGHFAIETTGNIQSYDLELDLWNAELKGSITTDKGRISIRGFVHASQNLMVVELGQDGNGKKPEITWKPYPNESPRAEAWSKEAWKKESPGYKPGPAGKQLTKSQDVSVWEQPLRPSGLASTAWKEIRLPNGNTGLYISIDHSFPKNTASDTAAELVHKAASINLQLITSSHRQWWHEFYPGAFVSLPDDYWEPFYWTQIYKIGSGMRADGPILDLQGPWTSLERNAWPGVWWNLNVQLTYWPCYTGNRLREALSLPNTMTKYRDNLILNVDEKYQKDSAGIQRSSGLDLRSAVGYPGDNRSSYASETGSLPWTCHNLFLHYRMTMNDSFLRNDVFPILRRAINYYLHFLEKGKDGKLHLPVTFSPEYGKTPDCNYDLSLLRWGCKTLLWSADRLEIKDPLIPKWKSVLENLVDYPVNENGYMVGQGKPFNNSHRHFSHLFMIYPLHNVDTTQPEATELTKKSTLHWLSLDKGLSGYSFTTGASIYATLGMGDKALEILNKVKPRIRANTIYPEPWPVMETPLSALSSIHDMLLQSWDDLVNVLPAVPAEWKDIVFHDLRAQGAFLVSAELKDGKIQWARVKSLAGEPLRLRVGIDPSAIVSGTGASALKKDEQGDWIGTPAKDAEILIALPGVKPVVSPVKTPGKQHTFGRP